MKKFTSLLMLTMVLAITGSCSKMKESPAPETIKNTGGGGGGGGGGGNPDIYIGLWKLEKTTWGGVDQAVDSFFQLQLNTGGLCTWNWYYPGDPDIKNTESMTYILNDKATPPNIDFAITDDTYGNKVIISKTATEIIWQYDIMGGAVLVEETLKKQ